MRDEDCVAFLQWALPRLGMRWPGFRRVRRQVCRRIARRMAELGLGDVDAYRRLLETTPEEWRRLDRCLFISVSRFYRDRAVFDFLGRTVLPALAEATRAGGRRTLRAWSAGCASGEEPYSLSILWRSAARARGPGTALEIMATDADPHLLERARRACYGAGSLKELPRAWRAAAFEVRAGLFCLRPEFCENVTLLNQDLRRAAPSGRFDLVLCRNVAFTYFDEDLQREVLERLKGKMIVGGALVLGRGERLPEPAFGFAPWSDGVFRRVRSRGLTVGRPMPFAGRRSREPGRGPGAP
jgi:chemotaxis protein methyltransferase CheR